MHLTPGRATFLLTAASATAALGVGVAHASTSHQTPTTTTATPLTVTVSGAREISRAARKIAISGRIGPTASLRGGAASLILYRETRSGLQQLSFNGAQTHPRANGTFTIESTGEPTGHNTYVVQYVPSAQGYAQQGVATVRLTVSG